MQFFGVFSTERDTNNQDVQWYGLGMGLFSEGCRACIEVTRFMGEAGLHGCCWEAVYNFAYCGLVVGIQPLNCQNLDFCPTSNVNQVSNILWMGEIHSHQSQTLVETRNDQFFLVVHQTTFPRQTHLIIESVCLFQASGLLVFTGKSYMPEDWLILKQVLQTAFGHSAFERFFCSKPCQAPFHVAQLLW